MRNDAYLPVLVLLFGAIGFAVAPLVLAWLWAKKFSPQKPGHDKNAIYECGLESSGDAWVQFKPGYYLYATHLSGLRRGGSLSLLPFAASFSDLTPALGACIAMLVFCCCW